MKLFENIVSTIARNSSTKKNYEKIPGNLKCSKMSSARFEYLLRPPPHELEEDGVVPWHVGPGRVGGDGLTKVHVRLGDGDL